MAKSAGNKGMAVGKSKVISSKTGGGVQGGRGGGVPKGTVKGPKKY